MFHHRSLASCPACSCQFFVEEQACPHCGAAVAASAGGGWKRTAASMALGLAVAAVPLAACGDDTGGGTGGSGQGGTTGDGGNAGTGGNGGAPGVGGDDSSSQMMSAYGVGPSVGGGDSVSTSTGDGGAGGDNNVASAYGVGGSF